MADDKKLIKKLREQLKAERADHECTRKERNRFIFNLNMLKDEEIEGLKADAETLKKNFKIVHGYLLKQIDFFFSDRYCDLSVRQQNRSLVLNAVAILAELEPHKIIWPKDKE